MESVNNKQEKGGEKMEDVARRNFANWKEALLTKKSEKVSVLYAENNTFLPTMSGDFRRGKKEAEGYFEHFLLINPDGKIVDEEIQPMGDNYYSHNGLYNFEVDEDGRRAVKECKFTFNWEKQPDGSWKILHHNSGIRFVGNHRK